MGRPVALFGGNNQRSAVITTGTTVSPATPPDVAIGDLLVLCAVFQNNSNAAGDPVATGWTHMGPSVTIYTDGRRPSGLYYKAITDASARTAALAAANNVVHPAGNSGRAAATIIRITGADLNNPEAAQSAWKTPSTDTSQTFNSTTLVAPDSLDLMVSFMNIQMNSTPAPASISWGGGVTEVADVPTLTSTTASHTVLGMYVENLAIGTSTARTGTMSVAQVANSGGYGVAIRGTLDGTATGAGMASGTLVPDVAGTAVGTGTATGSLQPTASGTATGAGTATGSLSPVVGGTAAGSGAASGSLAPGVAGSAAGAGTATGTLAPVLSGTRTGAGGATGALGPDVGGTATGGGSASGTLAATLTGSAPGSGTASAVLVPVLGGTAGGGGGSVGEVQIPNIINGSASGAGGASAQLAPVLSGAASGTGPTSGSLQPVLGGSADGTGGATGEVVPSSFSGVATGAGGASSSFQPTLVGTAGGGGTASGAVFEDVVVIPNQDIRITSGPTSGSKRLSGGPRRRDTVRITGPR